MFSERDWSATARVLATASACFLVGAFLMAGQAAARSAALEKVIEGANKEPASRYNAASCASSSIAIPGSVTSRTRCPSFTASSYFSIVRQPCQPLISM